MMHFPMRKCYHAAKVACFLVLVILLLSLFEQWRGGKRAVKAQFPDPMEDEYERQILEDEARIIPGLGEGGVAAHLTGEDKILGEESEKKLAINVHLSDRISYNRSLKDYRNPACQRVVYDAELPSASVIIIFHNEPYSVVVRTIWSVINAAKRTNPWFAQANFVDRETGEKMHLGYKGQSRTAPLIYLKEIILVDDNSTLPELKGKLSHYVRTRLPPDLIRILRLPDRIGLTRARHSGATVAVGDVMVFLDSHCEVLQDWLRPLLHRIKQNRTSVVTPLIDMIEKDTMQYNVGQSEQYFEVGGFTFMGHFTWIDVPEREKKRRGSDISPTWSPTMAGGLFAINREYYWELGAYDEQMAGWGGENLEMSFRIWQCGGTLETLPCSRVGHVFRSFHPYGLPAHSDTHGINTARMAEVWMDEYAELFYLHRPDLRNSPKIGDVTHRKVLRQKLHCKSFQWYLDNIYQEKFVPVRDVYGYGRFVNPASRLCLDTLQREGPSPALGAYPCHSRLHATQYLSLSIAGQLRNEEHCAELQFARDKEVSISGRRVLMAPCHDAAKSHRGQKWQQLGSGQLKHEESGLCLCAGRETGADVLAKVCSDDAEQKWKIDFTEENDFQNSNEVEPEDQQKRLLKLRGHRSRISRSLLSVGDNETRRSHSHHKRKRNKRKRRNRRSRRNKFVMRLVRTLMNGSEQHLEADVGCKHKRLLPNDTFVRDLVTILNENNIRVINNGRLFERNRVTDLSRARLKDSTPDAVQEVMSPPAPLPPLGAQSPLPPLPPPAPPHQRVESVTQFAALAPPPPEEKRIIIEDFVEVTSTSEEPPTLKPHKKRKRKHPLLPPTAPPTPHEPNVAPPAVLREGPKRKKKKSRSKVPEIKAEDWVKDNELLNEAPETQAPLQAEPDGDELQASAAEDWPLATARFRRNNTRKSLRRANSRSNERSSEHSSSSSEQREDRASERRATRAPVKLVMRTNLTFNLGDEFFAWRRRAKDDITDLLGELALPANHSRPSPQAWVRAKDAKPNDRSEDNAIADSDEDSSNSSS